MYIYMYILMSIYVYLSLYVYMYKYICVCKYMRVRFPDKSQYGPVTRPILHHVMPSS